MPGKNIALSFILIVLVCSCTYNDFPNKRSSEYFPNSVGNYWIYSVVDNNVLKYNVTVEIVGTQKLTNGKDALVWKRQSPWGNDTTLVLIENDTVKTYAKEYTTPSDLKFPFEVYPIPFSNGQTWNGKLYYYDFYTTKMIGSNYRISRHYVGPNMEYNDTTTFSPNVGFTSIKATHYNFGPVQVRSWNLLRYYLK